MNNNSLLISS